MNQPNEGYCLSYCKQFKGIPVDLLFIVNVYVIIMPSRVHRYDIKQHQVPVETALVLKISRNITIIEIDIVSKKSNSKRVPINTDIAERFTERYIRAITTHT